MAHLWQEQDEIEGRRIDFTRIAFFTLIVARPKEYRIVSGNYMGVTSDGRFVIIYSIFEGRVEIPISTTKFHFC